MPMEIAKAVLATYAWIVVGVLFFFLWRIAGFYERASGQRVGHRFVVLPGALLAAGAIWYLRRDSDFVGQPVGDLLLFLGGVTLLLFSNRLQKLMTGER
jgi:hypothetical protein